MKTFEEISKIAEQAWRKYNGFNLSYDEMAALEDACRDRANDVIFTHNGKKLTNRQCSMWLWSWSAYLDGFIAAYRMLDKE